jgi:leucyl/phenylalanyl-tRNA--protein transferase
VAFAVLVEVLREQGCRFVDCQVPTNHLKSLGAKEVSRELFLHYLEQECDKNTISFEV